MAKLKRTRTKLKIDVLPTDRMSGPDGLADFIIYLVFYLIIFIFLFY
jgi:hypothetical protein